MCQFRQGREGGGRFLTIQMGEWEMIFGAYFVLGTLLKFSQKPSEVKVVLSPS